MDISALSAERHDQLFGFLSQGKQLTQDRIRNCQILLNDLAVDGDLRESLEAIRSNAEDDFGTFLHLMTVLKVPEKVTVDVVTQGVANVNLDTSKDKTRCVQFLANNSLFSLTWLGEKKA